MATLLFASACEGTHPTSLTYYADVKSILDENCIGCHSAGAMAPMALDTPEAVKAYRAAIATEVGAQRMPPWYAASNSGVAYSNDPSLSDVDLQTVIEWATKEGGIGTAAQEPAHSRQVLPTLTRRDVELRIREPYTPKNTPDDYHCFVFDWPRDTTTFVVGMDATPDVLQMVHHIAVYLIPPDGLAELQDATGLIDQFDAHEPGDGYTCWGGPAGENEQIPAQQLAQWVPGLSAGFYPEGTGILVKPGSKLVLQMHYNTLYAPVQADQTTIAFAVTTSVERQAAFAPWLNQAWPTMLNMEIPAGEPDVRFSYQEEPAGFFGLLNPGIDFTAGFRIHSVLMHMHNLGSGATVKIVRADGSEQLLLEVPRWNFDWQIVYKLAEPVEFHPGDQMYVQCRFDNSSAHQQIQEGRRQTPADSNWGEGTSDEMCVANLYVSVDPSP